MPLDRDLNLFCSRAPLNHLDDCDLSKYYLQLNIYRYTHKRVVEKEKEMP